MFDAVPYLSNELVDPLGGYAELSSRFASGDLWFKKAKALQQPGCSLSALPNVGRNVPDQRLVSALPSELVETLLKLRESFQVQLPSGRRDLGRRADEVGRIDTKVDLIRDSGLGKSMKTEKPLLLSPHGSVGPRSEELGLRLFGVPGDQLLEADNLKRFIDEASEKRRAVAQEIQHRWIEYGRQLEEMFPGDGTKRILWEDPVSGRKREVFIGGRPTDEQEE